MVVLMPVLIPKYLHRIKGVTGGTVGRITPNLKKVFQELTAKSR